MRSSVLAVALTSALGALATLAAGAADAEPSQGSLDDMLGPREIAVGDAMRADATGAAAIDMNPADLPLTRELVFEGGYGYRQSDSASMLGVSACDSTTVAPGCFFYDYAGTNPSSDLGVQMPTHHTTSIAGLALSHAVTPKVFLGSTLKYFHYDTDVEGESGASGVTFDAGATLRLSQIVSFGVTGYNLYGTSSPEMPRAFGGGLAIKPLPILTLSYDMRWITSGDVHGARYGGGAELFLRTSNGQTGFPLRAGGLRDNSLGTTYVSAGVGMSFMTFGFDVGGRKSVSGMDDTMVLASLRLYGPREAAPGIE